MPAPNAPPGAAQEDDLVFVDETPAHRCKIRMTHGAS
jgi:hypothetical protein